MPFCIPESGKSGDARRTERPIGDSLRVVLGGTDINLNVVPGRRGAPHPRPLIAAMHNSAWDPPLAHSASVTMRKTLAERGFTRPSMTRPAPEKFRPPTAEEDEHLFKSTIGKRCSNNSRFANA